LRQIALDACVDVATIDRLNDMLDGDLLIVGQSLKLPGASGATPARPAAPASSTYTVADGDTLWSIAEQFNTSTAALVEANHLEDADRLALGTELVVPGGRASAAPAATPSPAPAAARSTAAPSAKRIMVPYTVQPGETLSQIAKQFDVRSDAIAQASGVDDPNRIVVGAVLKVPLPGYEHIVKAGETLRDIAAQEKVDLGSLIDFNELDDPGLIRVGQVVLVPAPAPNLQAAALQAAGPSAPAAAPAPAAAAAPKPTAPPAAAGNPAPPKPAAPAPKPIAVAARPAGAPTDGIAGAGLKFLGSPYVWGGSSPSGFDCSGFVWYTARQAGKSISRGMLGEYNSGSHPGRDELKPGDLVFFQNTYTAGLSHNGIYLGNGQFVHAADEQAGVTISSLSSAYWSSHWFGATRLS
jgi:cell wall-associated NlpC family hydrolase